MRSLAVYGTAVKGSKKRLKKCRFVKRNEVAQECQKSDQKGDQKGDQKVIKK
jgi:hypothetical protein